MGRQSTTIVFAKESRQGRSKTVLPGWLQANLVVLEGADAGAQFPVTEHCTVIGRGREADVVLRDTSVSRRHASLVYKNLEFRLRDLDSANGTLLNGYEVKEYVIRNGDRITLGETVLRFQIEKATPAP